MMNDVAAVSRPAQASGGQPDSRIAAENIAASEPIRSDPVFALPDERTQTQEECRADSTSLPAFKNSKYFPNPPTAGCDPSRAWFLPSQLLEGVACMVAPMMTSCSAYKLRFDRPLKELRVSTGTEGVAVLRLSVGVALMTVLGCAKEDFGAFATTSQDGRISHVAEMGSHVVPTHNDISQLPLTLSFNIVEIVEHLHDVDPDTAEWNRRNLFIPGEWSRKTTWHSLAPPPSFGSGTDRARIEALGGMIRVDPCCVESGVVGGDEEWNGLRVSFRFPVLVDL
ncbi:hypothetical protein HDU97_007970 [Phlyctochytrium planicorne]|nr:hypothetical protein HDU97_007970 [Phlyctochytrium planicorne]